jgi:hypothetical protein
VTALLLREHQNGRRVLSPPDKQQNNREGFVAVVGLTPQRAVRYQGRSGAPDTRCSRQCSLNHKSNDCNKSTSVILLFQGPSSARAAFPGLLHSRGTWRPTDGLPECDRAFSFRNRKGPEGWSPSLLLVAGGEQQENRAQDAGSFLMCRSSSPESLGFSLAMNSGFNRPIRPF